MLCSYTVIYNKVGSSESTKKVQGEHSLPECFITEQSTVEAFSCFMIKKIYDFPRKFAFYFQNKLGKWREHSSVSSVLYTLIKHARARCFNQSECVLHWHFNINANNTLR